jgi:hypothetical protein
MVTPNVDVFDRTMRHDLGFGRKFAYFIEENCSSIGQFKAAQASLSRSREGPLLAAEQRTKVG